MKKEVLIILLLTVFFTFTGCRNKPEAAKQPEVTRQNQTVPQPVTESDKNKINLILFFPNNSGTYLMPVSRLATFNTSIERTIVEEILKGPGTAELKNPILERTKLLSIAKKEDTIIADFSRDFVKNNPVQSRIMAVYSIVNSLTEIPGIKKVVLKVEGKGLESTGGTTFTEPFKRNRSLFKRDKTLKPNEILKMQMDFEAQGKWFDAYLLYSDDENNTYRKYYDDYVKESEDAAARGFITKNFTVDNYSIDDTGTRAKVKVRFNETGRDLNIGLVKIEGAWLVDWIPPQ